MRTMWVLVCSLALAFGTAAAAFAGEPDDPGQGVERPAGERAETRVQKLEEGVKKEAAEVGKVIEEGEAAVEKSLQGGAQNYGAGLTD